MNENVGDLTTEIESLREEIKALKNSLQRTKSFHDFVFKKCREGNQGMWMYKKNPLDLNGDDVKALVKRYFEELIEKLQTEGEKNEDIAKRIRDGSVHFKEYVLILDRISLLNMIDSEPST